MDPTSDDEASKRTFDDIFRLWVTPEIKRRQEAGLPCPKDVRAAQVIMHPDERPATVRLNEEVRAIVKIKLNVAKEAGEAILESEFSEVVAIKLTDLDDPDCGHVTVLRFSDRWHFGYDFRRNKSLSVRHLELAREFHAAARSAVASSSTVVAVDTLFSAAELAAKAWLLLLPDPDFARRATHRAIQTKYQTIGRLNLEPAFIDTLNKLSGWRASLRYCKGVIQVDEQALVTMVSTVAEMIEDAARAVE